MPQYNLQKAKHNGINKPPKNIDENCVSISSGTTDFLTILQCNIGGAPQSRLAVGSTLRTYINLHSPTIIVLTETKRSRRYIPVLPGYGLFTLNPLPGSSGGIAFYYKDSLQWRISKVLASSKNSIMWVHLQHHRSRISDLYICAVYAVHSGGHNDMRTSFWKELGGSTTKFQEKQGSRILDGDFNSRLGPITGDHDTNANQDELLSFINDHSLLNMNIIRAFGKYTFHNISNGNRSIIDYLLTDMDECKIPEHEVLPGSLGTSAQTAHKAILSKIMISLKNSPPVSNKRKPRWRTLSEHNRELYILSLKQELSEIKPGHYKFQSLLAAINRAKTNSLGRTRPKPKNAVNPTPELDALDLELGTALEAYYKNPL